MNYKKIIWLDVGTHFGQEYNSIFGSNFNFYIKIIKRFINVILKRQKSINSNSKLALMSSMMKIKTDVIAKKKRAKAGFQVDAVESNMTYVTWVI